MSRYITNVKAKLVDKRGKVYDALLEGEQGADLFGGKIRIRGKWVEWMKIPKNLFPFRSLKKTPFIDVPIANEKKGKQTDYMTDTFFYSQGNNTEDKIKRILGKK